jgi:hypothetical protein
VNEIMATLNQRGETDQLPFMTEMIKYAGQRFRVSSVAHKTCDTICGTGGRRLGSAVHLEELRCDGADHGGCQARCLLFWKLAWLRKADVSATTVTAPESLASTARAINELKGHAAAALSSAGKIRYRCQATQLFDATKPLHWWDVRQYWMDVRSGNASPGHAARVLALACAFSLRRLPFGYRMASAIYDWLPRFLVGRPSPQLCGTVPAGMPTPSERIELGVGDLVRIREKEEIERTIDQQNRNRGMRIDEEEMVYCGEVRRVEASIDHIINERTGEMVHFKTPCVILEGVYCRGEYSENRLLCPRRILSYWRYDWLEPLGGVDVAAEKHAPDE